MEPNKTFIIRHKETKELWRAPSGKSSWRAKGHAKNAWSHLRTWHCTTQGIPVIVTQNSWGRSCRAPLFDEQDIYEIVELVSGTDTKLAAATALLRQCLGRITDTYIEEKVKEFLTEVGIEH